MARAKMLSAGVMGRVIGAATWCALAAATLTAAYGCGAIAAHAGTWISWR